MNQYKNYSYSMNEYKKYSYSMNEYKKYSYSMNENKKYSYSMNEYMKCLQICTVKINVSIMKFDEKIEFSPIDN